MHARSHGRIAAALSLAVLAACGGADRKTGAGEDTGTADAITPQPLAFAAFPVDSNTINSWINNSAGPDSAAIRAHAWALWAGLTAMTDQTANGAPLPVYETWYSRYEVYGEDAPQKLGGGQARDEGTRDFHRPRQFGGVSVHASRLAAVNDTVGGADERVIAGVKYNTAAAQHVWNNNYFQESVLTRLNAGFPDTLPIASRNIQPFPDSAMALKPTYWLVNSTGITVMPYWAGPNASTNPQHPSPQTWNQFVGIDPTGQNVGKQVYFIYQGQLRRAQVVGLDRFYSFVLDQDEVNAIQDTTDQAMDVIVSGDTGQTQSLPFTPSGALNPTAATVEPGDYAVLVGMHVTSKEIGNWTWQTFWWTPGPSQDPLASDAPSSVKAPFNNYAMKTAYYMTVPNGPAAGENEVTFNPYLETDLPGPGVQSNCMSCHRTATWPGASTTSGDYPAYYGLVNPGDSTIFAKQLKLDFLWSIQAGASSRPQPGGTPVGNVEAAPRSP